jgi:hypothetical protein
MESPLDCPLDAFHRYGTRPCPLEGHCQNTAPSGVEHRQDDNQVGRSHPTLCTGWCTSSVIQADKAISLVHSAGSFVLPLDHRPKQASLDEACDYSYDLTFLQHYMYSSQPASQSASVLKLNPIRLEVGERGRTSFKYSEVSLQSS